MLAATAVKAPALWQSLARLAGGQGPAAAGLAAAAAKRGAARSYAAGERQQQAGRVRQGLVALLPIMLLVAGASCWANMRCARAAAASARPSGGRRTRNAPAQRVQASTLRPPQPPSSLPRPAGAESAVKDVGNDAEFDREIKQLAGERWGAKPASPWPAKRAPCRCPGSAAQLKHACST